MSYLVRTGLAARHRHSRGRTYRQVDTEKYARARTHTHARTHTRTRARTHAHIVTRTAWLRPGSGGDTLPRPATYELGVRAYFG